MGWFSISDIWRTATEPVRLTFFCTPYPTTTTSSMLCWVSFSTTVRCVRLPTSTCAAS